MNNSNEQPSSSIRTLSFTPNLPYDNGREYLLCNFSTTTERIPIIIARNRSIESSPIILNNSGGKGTYHSDKKPNIHLPHYLRRDEAGDRGLQQPFLGLNTILAPYDPITTIDTLLSLSIMGNTLTQPSPEPLDVASKPGSHHISNPALPLSSYGNNNLPWPTHVATIEPHP